MRWDDWPLLLAIAQGGSLAQAARDLKIDYTTVYRRLNEIERGLKLRVFERTRSACTPTAAGARLLEGAAQAREAMDSALLDVAGADARLAGGIRFTTIASIAEWVLMPMLREFRQRYPLIQVELLESFAAVNLAQREADVALRFTNDPPPGMVGIKIGRAYSAVYASRAYLDERPGLSLAELDWIQACGSATSSAEARWYAEHVPGEQVVLKLNTGPAAQRAAANDIGLCMLICYLGDAAGLVRVTEPVHALDTDIWLLCHPNLRQVARIRAFLDFMRQALKAQLPLLQGQTSIVDPRPLRAVSA